VHRYIESNEPAKVYNALGVGIMLTNSVAQTSVYGVSSRNSRVSKLAY